MNMYVSNLDANFRDNDLKSLFTPFGEVTSAKVITDRDTGLSKKFGFVEMRDDAAAQKAMAELNTSDGRGIKVTEARPREDRGPRNNGGGGFRSNRY